MALVDSCVIPQCCYEEDEGHTCSEAAGASGLCYWHDPTQCKTAADCSALEAYARSGGQMRGISLRRADMPGLNLAAGPSQQGFDLTHADLYRANLRGAHLYKVKLHQANLMKADLREANAHWVELQQANLLGVKWTGARIEHIQLGDKLRQENIAHQAVKIKDRAMALDYFEQSEEIYRDLRKAAEHEGLFSRAGFYIQQELRMRRFQYPVWSYKRMFSKMIDVFCGYGEDPVRVVLFSLLLIFICSFFYLFLGVSFQGEVLQYQSDHSWQQNLNLLFNCMYYSVVTFTTLGYGDITPVGGSRLVAAIEAFTGSFTIALFVVVFVKKMTR